jgi:hypothetical protein
MMRIDMFDLLASARVIGNRLRGHLDTEQGAVRIS